MPKLCGLAFYGQALPWKVASLFFLANTVRQLSMGVAIFVEILDCLTFRPLTLVPTELFLERSQRCGSSSCA